MDKYACLQELWDFLYIAHPLKQADAIIGFGSHDLGIATRAADIYRAGWAPLIVFTGYLGKGTLGVFQKSEAETYARIAMQSGVPPEAILLETKATNTGENIRFSRKLLEDRGLTPKRIIAVHKPYMTRRVLAALQKQWPQVEVIVAPGDSSLRDYLTAMTADGTPEQEVINFLVGDFQRMETYAKLGFQAPQDIPPKAWASFEALVKLGYDRYVV